MALINKEKAKKAFNYRSSGAFVFEGQSPIFEPVLNPLTGYRIRGRIVDESTDAEGNPKSK